MNFHTRCGFVGTCALVVALGQSGNMQTLQTEWPATFTPKWTVEVGEGGGTPRKS